MSQRTETTLLCCVVNGKAYEDYAAALFKSARQHFRPTPFLETLLLPGPAGWPAATMMRYHVLLEHWQQITQRYGYVFLSDADMLFEADVGAEVIPPFAGITATLHPGYVGKHFSELPYETRPESACYVKPTEGDQYFCGGFIGGETTGFHWLVTQIVRAIDADLANGITPRWHDESAVNYVLAAASSEVTLSPAYCYPDHDDYYVNSVWPERYERKLVALDKAAHERGER